MASIELGAINKVYPNGFHAVHDLDISVADGEFMVLVGPSGCGKTTALRMVAGLEEITTGSLRIGDRDVTTLPASRPEGPTRCVPRRPSCAASWFMSCTNAVLLPADHLART